MAAFTNADRILLAQEVARLTDGGKDCARNIAELAQDSLNEGVKLAANRTLLHILGVATDSPQRVQIDTNAAAVDETLRKEVEDWWTTLTQTRVAPAAERRHPAASPERIAMIEVDGMPLASGE